MSDKIKKVVPTLEELEREAKRLKKEEKRRKSGKKPKEVVGGPGATPKQKKKFKKVMDKMIKDKLKDVDIDDPVR